MKSNAGIRWGTYLTALIGAIQSGAMSGIFGCAFAALNGAISDYSTLITTWAKISACLVALMIATHTLICTLQFYRIFERSSERGMKFLLIGIFSMVATALTMTILAPRIDPVIGLALYCFHDATIVAFLFVAVYSRALILRLRPTSVFSIVFRIRECRVRI